MHTTLNIFWGYLPTIQCGLKRLKPSNKREKEVARNAIGDCFIYSERNGIVEFIVPSDFHECDGSEYTQHSSMMG
jgi:hypothetical protein